MITNYRRTVGASVLSLSLLGAAAGLGANLFGSLAGAVAGATSVAPAASDTSNGGHPSLDARFAQLTDSQRGCLTDAGLTRPEGRPTVEQREALRQTAQDCGVAVPDRAGKRPAGVDTEHPGKGTRFAPLTDEQEACLTDAGLTRPEGQPTSEQRQALSDAAADCGIAVPAGPGNYGGRPAA